MGAPPARRPSRAGRSTWAPSTPWPGSAFRVLAIPGLVEGGYPGVLRPDPFLLDDERDRPREATRAVSPGPGADRRAPPRGGPSHPGDRPDEPLRRRDPEPGGPPRLHRPPATPAPATCRSSPRPRTGSSRPDASSTGPSRRPPSGWSCAYPRADARTGRERLPSLFFAAAASTLAGRPLAGADLAGVVTEDDPSAPAPRGHPRPRGARPGPGAGGRPGRRGGDRRRLDVLQAVAPGGAGPLVGTADALRRAPQRSARGRREADRPAPAGPGDVREPPGGVRAVRLSVHAPARAAPRGRDRARGAAAPRSPRARDGVPRRGRALPARAPGPWRAAGGGLRGEPDTGPGDGRRDPRGPRGGESPALHAPVGSGDAALPRERPLVAPARGEDRRPLDPGTLRGGLRPRARAPARASPTTPSPSRSPSATATSSGSRARSTASTAAKTGSSSATTRPAGPRRTTGASSAGGRQLQIPFYVLATERLFPGEKVVEAFLDYVDGGRQVAFDPGVVRGDTFRALLRKLVDLIGEGRLRAGAVGLRLVRLHHGLRAEGAPPAAAADQDPRRDAPVLPAAEGRGMSFRPVDEEARERARSDHATSLVIEAGAGTGKTTLLVDRIESLVRSGDAAARRDRRGDLHRERGHDDEAPAARAPRGGPGRPGPDRRRSGSGRRGRSRSSSAPASRTIHALCAAILQERPLECGVVPGFRMADEAEADMLFAAAWEEWLGERLTHGDDVLLEALDRGIPLEGLSSWGERSSLRGLARVLLEQRDLEPLVAAAAVRPAGGPRGAAREGDAGAGARRLRPGRRRPGREARRPRGPRRAGALPRGAGARRAPARPPERAEELRAPPPLAQPRGPRRGTGHRGLGEGVGGGLARRPRGRRPRPPRAGARGSRDALRAAARPRGASSTSWTCSLKTRDALRDRPAVRAHFQRRFRYLIIDEFQDTDPLQVEIARLLAGDRPGALVVVGDAKQSIYRFRRAEVRLFRELARRGALRRRVGPSCTSSRTSARAPRSCVS